MKRKEYLELKKYWKRKINWCKKKLKNNNYKTPNRIKYLNNCIEGFQKQVKTLNKIWRTEND